MVSDKLNQQKRSYLYRGGKDMSKDTSRKFDAEYIKEKEPEKIVKGRGTFRALGRKFLCLMYLWI